MGVWDWYSYFLFGSALAFALFFLHQYDLLKGRDYFIYLVIGLVPCFCLYAIRHPDVGIDLVRYARQIEVARFGAKFNFFYTSGQLALEPLSRLLTFVSYYLGGLQPFIILTSVIQYIFIFIFLRRLHLKGFNVAIVFLIYFSVIQLRCTSMVRNGLAISAAFCAYTYLLDEKKRGFWLFTLLALGFHNSALINIPVYFVCKPISGGYWDKLINVALKAIAFFSIIFFIFVLKSGAASVITDSFADGRYSHYEMNNSWGVGNIIVRLPCLCLFGMYLKDMMGKYGKNIISIFYLMIFDLVISMSRYIYSDLERLTQYTAYGEIFFIPLFYEYIRKKCAEFPFQFIIYPIVIAYFTVYIYRWAIVSNYGIMPYKFMEW